jgi:hypothetical protein
MSAIMARSAQRRLLLLKGPSKKSKRKQGTKNNPGKKQPTDFPFIFFFFCRLSPMRVGCGHATACGHPQLAVGSSFTS